MKILFVDIDGTLTETVSGKQFKQNPDDIKPVDGAKEAIAKKTGSVSKTQKSRFVGRRIG